MYNFISWRGLPRRKPKLERRGPGVTPFMQRDSYRSFVTRVVALAIIVPAFFSHAGHAQLHLPITDEIPALYAATSTLCFNFAPIYGQAGDSITITGQNLDKAQRVLFFVPESGPSTDHPGQDAMFTITSSNTIIATVPSPIATGAIAIITANAVSVCKSEFVGPHWIQFVIATAGNDLLVDSSATATLQGPDASTIQTIMLKSQGDPAWNSGTTQVVSAPLANPGANIGSILITLTSHNSLQLPWDVQSVNITLNTGVATKQVLISSGNPLKRLSDSQQTLILPLVPALDSPPCRQPAACIDVATYHNDSLRTGWNSGENALTPATIQSLPFGRLATVPLDDRVNAQPLQVGGVLYVATESNTVYGINFLTGVMQIRNLGIAVAEPENCNGPHIGVDSTPVIDAVSGTLYVVAYSIDNTGQPAYQLHALDLTTLMDRPGSPVPISATHSIQGGLFSFNATYQRQRPGLLLANGRIYAGFGTWCDQGGSNARGWLLGWDKTSLALLPSSQLNNRLPATGTQYYFASSIWMSGFGIAGDDAGILYFVTGNSARGTYNSLTNISETAVKSSDDLSRLLDFFTPSNVNALDYDPNSGQPGDTDFGSGGLLVLPDQSGQFPRLAVAAGKDGRMFLLNRDNMGGFNPTDVPSDVQIGECFCGPAYFESGSSANKVSFVVSSGGTQLQVWALSVTGAPPRASLVLAASAGIDPPATGTDGGFFTSVTSNGTTPNSAIIWAVGRADATGQVKLYAFNGTPSGNRLPLLWSDWAGSWPNGGFNSYIVPTVANGFVYLASDSQLQIFGTGRTAPSPIAGAAPIARAAPQLAPGVEFWGVVYSIEGDHMTLELRDGRLLQVDLRPAISQARMGTVLVGRPANVTGKMGPDRILEADTVTRAKGRALWGPDRD